MTSAGLVTMETTNDVFDHSLYNALTPQSVLSWMRAIVANRMATGGRQWTDLFARENSGAQHSLLWPKLSFSCCLRCHLQYRGRTGTYNNQWYASLDDPNRSLGQSAALVSRSFDCCERFSAHALFTESLPRA
jgi:hypothetical protein